MAAALAPVREALLARAQGERARVLEAVDEQTAAVTAAAEQEAASLLAQAREQGSADAALVAAAEESRARRESRALVLGAQHDAYEELRRRSVEAVGRLRDDPAYPQLQDRLRQEAIAQLGPAAEVVEDPAGGVVAVAGGRSVDLSLPVVALRAVDALGDRVTTLWEP